MPQAEGDALDRSHREGCDPSMAGDARHADGDAVGRRGRSRRRAWAVVVGRLLLAAAFSYAGVCVLITLLQSRLIYFPTREYEATPEDLGLRFDDLTLTTEDGVSLAAWYVPHPLARGSVIFCHGNGGNISHRLHSVQLLHNMGVNVLILDYRGFGRSQGKPSEKGTYRDAEAAWRYLVETRHQPVDHIVLFGRSLGGAVAIELAARHEPAGLVVESTFTNLVDIGRLHFPLLPVRLLLTYRYDSIEKIRRITCPKLFFHGSGDTLIPIENGRLLYGAAPEPKQFVETPGGHNEAGFTYSSEFSGRLAAFLEETLPPS